MEELDHLHDYGVKFKRKSARHIEVEDMVLKGSFKAAHVRAYQHAVGFDAGKKNLSEAHKLGKIAMPEELPDTFFLFSIISNVPEVQYARLKIGFSFDSNSTFGEQSWPGYSNTAKEKLYKLEQQLTTSEKLAANKLIQSCKDKKNYNNCINR